MKFYKFYVTLPNNSSVVSFAINIAYLISNNYAFAFAIVNLGQGAHKISSKN